MRKKITISIFLLSILFLVSFGTIVKAQNPTYLGVNEGDKYQWKVNIDFEGVDTLVSNMREVIVDQQNRLGELDIFGWEDLTINETLAEIATSILDYILPTGWEADNLSIVVEMIIIECIAELNTSIFSGKIPSNWETLNYSTFYDYMVDGLYASTGSGFENDPIPELIELIATELNSSILAGRVPEGLMDLNFVQFFLSLYDMAIPGISESYFLNSMIGEAFQQEIPPEISDLSIEELLTMLVQPYGLNATSLFEQLFLLLSSVIPPGLESEPMSVLIDYLNNQIEAILPAGYNELSMEELINFATDMYVGSFLPQELHDLTLAEIISLGFNQLLFYYDNLILPQWNQFELMLQASGMVNYEIGLKLVIDNIGTSEPLFPDGPQRVDLDTTLFYSLDFENWINISMLTTMLNITETDMFDSTTTSMQNVMISSLLSPLFNFIMGETIVFDPSSYSNIDVAITDQLMYSGGLIVARNNDWSDIQKEISIETLSDPNCIDASIIWNNKGVLRSVSIDGSENEAINITLIEEKGILGYEIPIIFGLMILSLIGIIIHINRK